MNDDKMFADFGLSDLQDEQDNTAVSVALTVFGVVVWLLLAWTTAEFFALYASGFGARFGVNAAIFVALVGIVLIDCGYVAWTALGVKRANSNGQLTVAMTAGVILFLISLASTLVYTVLNSAFSGDLIGPATRQQLAIIGQAVITGALAVNGLAAFGWLTLSHAWRKSKHIAELRSLIYSKRFSIDQQRANLVAGNTAEKIRRGMLAGVGVLADRQSGEYLQNAQMSQARSNGEGQAADALGFRLVDFAEQQQRRPTDDEIAAFLRRHPEFRRPT